MSQEHLAIADSADLFKILYARGLLANSPLYWWSHAFSLECVVGVILTQNTQWKNVEKSLQNLRALGLFQDQDQDLITLAHLDANILASHILPSGCYNQKAARLIALSNAILQDFETFANFVQNVSREWLLAQKGIGFESADSILNYVCGREVMVVDRYTQRLISAIGFEFESYEDLQEWCQRGVRQSQATLMELSKAQNLAHLFMLFHGLITEAGKQKLKLGDIL